MIWFTSDLHLSHNNIIKYCNRPFNNIKEMDESIINNFNSLVKPMDIVYILGDFCFGGGTEHLHKMNGIKHLIEGSHDKKLIINCWRFFKSITPMLIINENKIPITLNHYAMYRWPKSHYNSYHLFGHSHGHLEGIGKSWDVGVDKNNFKPLNINQVFDIMSTLPDNPGLVNKNNEGVDINERRI